MEEKPLLARTEPRKEGSLVLTNPSQEEHLIALTIYFADHKDVDAISVKPKLFSDPTLKSIAEVIQECLAANCLPNLPNVHSQIVMNGLDKVISLDRLAALTNKAVTPSEWKSVHHKVVETYKNREVYRTLSSTKKALLDKPSEIDEIVENASVEFYNVMSLTEENEFERKPDILTEVLSEVFNPTKTLISSSIPALDEVIGGLLSEDLIIVAGRPGMGKTALVVSMMNKMAESVPVGFFSLDMGRHQIWHRFLSNHTDIGIHKFRQWRSEGGNPFDPVEIRLLEEAKKNLTSMPLHIDAGNGYTLASIKKRLRNLVLSKGVKAIFIDHIGKVTNPTHASNREREIGSIAEDLKRFAKEFELPVIVLSQLNRQVEARVQSDGAHKRPRLSDLRDSGSLEQEADVVMMLYRPEYYKVYQWEDNSNARDQLEIQVEKNRSGETRNIRLGCQLSTSKIFDR